MTKTVVTLALFSLLAACSAPVESEPVEATGGSTPEPSEPSTGGTKATGGSTSEKPHKWCFRLGADIRAYGPDDEVIEAEKGDVVCLEGTDDDWCIFYDYETSSKSWTMPDGLNPDDCEDPLAGMGGMGGAESAGSDVDDWACGPEYEYKGTVVEDCIRLEGERAGVFYRHHIEDHYFTPIMPGDKRLPTTYYPDGSEGFECGDEYRIQLDLDLYYVKDCTDAEGDTRRYYRNYDKSESLDAHLGMGGSPH